MKTFAGTVRGYQCVSLIPREARITQAGWLLSLVRVGLGVTVTVTTVRVTFTLASGWGAKACLRLGVRLSVKAPG